MDTGASGYAVLLSKGADPRCQRCWHAVELICDLEGSKLSYIKMEFSCPGRAGRQQPSHCKFNSDVTRSAKGCDVLW